MSLNARSLLLICWTSGCWAFSFGVGSQVVSHWLHARGITDDVIGHNHALYYLGVALGSCAVPWLNRRLGPIRCAAIGMILTGCTLASFPLGEGIGMWHALRLLNGWASAMSLVPLETIVSRDSPASQKTRNFSFYGLSLTIGGAIGIWMGLHLYHPGEWQTFYLGGGAPLLAGGLVLAGLARYRPVNDAQEVVHPLGWGRNFLSYGTAWFQGFLEGGLLAFLSLFLLARGYSSDEAGTLMSVTMIGVILFQVPVGWMADRCGRVPTLLGCYTVAAISLVGIPSLGHAAGIAVALFFLGACTGAMYPLGLAMLGDRMPASGLARAYAWYLAVECVGSQAGAAAMGEARVRWGEASMFPVGLAALVLVLTTWLVLQILQKGRQAFHQGLDDKAFDQRAA